MSDKALENAEVKKKQLVAERLSLHNQIVEIDRQIGKIDGFIKDWHAFADDTPDSLAAESGESTENENKEGSSQSTKRKTTGNSRKEVVAEEARQIIQERGVPVSRSDLYHALIERGLVINGRDPEMVLSTMLWRTRDRVQRVEGGGYWLAEIEPPKPAQRDNSDLL